MFTDRTDAGRALAALLQAYKGRHDVTVLALPRGGVPVASVVAQSLAAPLDVLIVRKLGTPGQPELAMGAIASGGVQYLQQQVIDMSAATAAEIDAIIARETAELHRREHLYRGARPPLDVRGRVVIVVDDGMATGASMIVALSALQQLHPAKVVVAVPVAPAGAEQQLRGSVDEFVCAQTPMNFRAVGQFYQHFEQTTDAEVRELLAAPAETRE